MWDGSEAGPEDAPTVHVRSRRALRRLLWAPGELGLAEAYITGDLDLAEDGGADLGDVLRTVRRAVSERGLAPPVLSLSDRLAAVGTALRLGAAGPRPPVPAARAGLSGTLHSKARDRAAISHHYDLSNAFYALLLDATMAYSCGYWTSDAPGYGPVDAQRDKLELICRKLGLRPGARLLDIGCGWGSLTLYAAEHHGVRVTAVTLAAEQAAYVRGQVAARGLEELVEVENIDYRDIAERPETRGAYDAVSTIEMGEHVGDAEYPAFTRILHDSLRPQGRVLVQQMSRGANAPAGARSSRRTSPRTCTCGPSGRPSGCWRGPGSKCGTSKPCASTMCSLWTPGGGRWRSGGRSSPRWWGGDRAGLAALSRRRLPRVRGAADGRRPDPLRTSRPGGEGRDAGHPA